MLLLLTLAGTLMSMFAWNLPSLIVGRFVVGLSSSLITISATSGLAALAAHGCSRFSVQRVAMVASFLNVLGFGLGPLVGGVAGQWLPQPLMSAYVLPLLLGCAGAWGMAMLAAARHAGGRSRGMGRRLRWQDCRPRLIWPARSDSAAFALTCGYPFVAFGVFGLYASMAPLFCGR